MDKVYCLWRAVRYEGKGLIGLYKDQQSAIAAAKAYVEESYRRGSIRSNAVTTGRSTSVVCVLSAIFATSRPR